MRNTSTAENRRSRSGLVWIAAAVGAVLLGGSTFAYWSANSLFTGGTITAGDLNLVQTADTTFFDVSADRNDAIEVLPGTDGTQKGHLIDDIDTWRMVPGDKVAAALESTVTLKGDNLVAKLSVAGLGNITNTNSSLTWSYEVYKNDVILVAETALPTDGALMYLAATTDGQDDGLEDADGTIVKAMAADSETFTIVIYATFDDEAGKTGKANVDAETGLYNDQSTGSGGTRQDAGSTAVLGDILLQLDQVRDTGVIFKPLG